MFISTDTFLKILLTNKKYFKITMHFVNNTLYTILYYLFHKTIT